MIGQIAASQGNDVDIEITCKDRRIQCPSPLQGLCYPVKLERIEASLPRAFPNPTVKALFSIPGFFLTQIRPSGNENLANTVTFTPSHGFQETFLYQQQCTASNHKWSDITVTRAYTHYSGIATLEGWRLHYRGSSWTDQRLFAPGPLIDLPLASSLVILHELMHSVALQTPACKCPPSWLQYNAAILTIRQGAIPRFILEMQTLWETWLRPEMAGSMA